jgi:hypothetical protein
MLLPQTFQALGWRMRRWVHAGLCAALFATGCGGGGVDSGGTGTVPVASSSFASGPITGFGSVIVGGVHYDERSARISDADGNARGKDDLKLGMMVQVQGDRVVADAQSVLNSTAAAIVYGSTVSGPVSTIDTAGQALTVLGQRVSVNPETVFDTPLAGGLTALSVGDWVEVYGFSGDLPGRVVATRIERRSGAPAAVILRGAAGAVDTVAQRFDLGGLTVSYADVDLQGGGEQLPANGAFIRVTLRPSPVGGVWQAVRLQRDGGQASGESRLDGAVTSFASSTRFSVEGTAVDASAAVMENPGAALGLGARVRVEGRVQGGVLIASRVEVKSESPLRDEWVDLGGPIDSIDPVGRTFVVRGLTVNYGGAGIEFKDGTVADLAVGRPVQVRGVLLNGTQVRALRIRLRS